MDGVIFAVRIVTIYIRGIYMIVFERIFLCLFGEHWSSSWKRSRRVLRSFSSGVYDVSSTDNLRSCAYNNEQLKFTVLLKVDI